MDASDDDRDQLDGDGDERASKHVDRQCGRQSRGRSAMTQVKQGMEEGQDFHRIITDL